MSIDRRLVKMTFSVPSKCVTYPYAKKSNLEEFVWLLKVVF